jgi:RNase H-fold protein (predicted Holliday junction resolvase)
MSYRLNLASQRSYNTHAARVTRSYVSTKLYAACDVVVLASHHSMHTSVSRHLIFVFVFLLFHHAQGHEARMLQERGSTKRALQQLHKMGLKRHKALKRLIVQLEDERSGSTTGSGEHVRY